MNNVDKELAKRAKHMYSYQASVETIAKELGTSVRQVTFWLIESGFILSNQPPLAGKTTKLQIIQEIEAILDLEGQLSDFMKVDKKTLTLSCRRLQQLHKPSPEQSMRQYALDDQKFCLASGII